MKIINNKADILAISLSTLCLIHCFLLPSLLIYLSSLVTLNAESELFHLLAVFSVFPVSIYALVIGYKKHRKITFLILGFIGLFFLLIALFLEKKILGLSFEEILTFFGSSIIILSHSLNLFFCRHSDCDCHSHIRKTDI